MEICLTDCIINNHGIKSTPPTICSTCTCILTIQKLNPFMVTSEAVPFYFQPTLHCVLENDHASFDPEIGLVQSIPIQCLQGFRPSVF